MITLKKLLLVFGILFAVVSSPLCAELEKNYYSGNANKHTALHQNHQITLAGVAIYYVWCRDEKKRIGGYSGDLKVINNRAAYHSRTYGHNTGVERK